MTMPKKEDDTMSLYSNYGPDDDSTMSLKQFERIEQRQANLQAEFEDQAQRDHFHFYGKFNNQTEFDVTDFGEILSEAYENNAELPQIYNWLIQQADFQQVCQKLTSQSITVRAVQKLIFQTTDENYQNLLDLVQQIFDENNIDIHQFEDDFTFIYDLDNVDDLRALADEYYEG